MECLYFVNRKMKDIIGDVVLVTRSYIPIDIVNQREDNQFVLIRDPLIMPGLNCFVIQCVAFFWGIFFIVIDMRTRFP